MKILVGEISSYKAIVIVKYISKNYPDVIICSYDTKKKFKYIHSKYVDFHFHIANEDWELQLQSIIKKEKIDFFFPVINHSIPNILKHKSKYGKSLNYVGNYNSYNILNDKSILQKLANEMDILVPETFHKISQARIPFVVKPTNLSSAKGVRYITDEKMKESLSLQEKYIVQEYIYGVGVGYSFYCKDGIISHGYGHKRLAEFPVKGGASTYRTYYHNNLMHDVAARIVEEINYTGFAMFEFKITEKNELYLIEVNPRIWGSINQGIRDGGVNYFEDILGEKTPKENIFYKNVETYIPLLYLSLIGYLIKFRFKPIRHFIFNLFDAKSDVGIIEDPMGYLSTVVRRVS